MAGPDCLASGSKVVVPYIFVCNRHGPQGNHLCEHYTEGVLVHHYTEVPLLNPLGNELTLVMVARSLLA